MIYGNRLAMVQNDTVYENLIMQECLSLERLIYDNDHIMLERSDFGESAKRILQKLKDFIKSIPGKIKALWSKLKQKILALLSKTKKKDDSKGVSNIKEIISFEYIPYIESAVDDTEIEMSAFHDLQNFIEKYISPDLKRNEYTDQQQLFADAINIIRKTVTTKTNYGLNLSKKSSISEMIDTIKNWQDFIEGKKSKITNQSVMDAYDQFDADEIKDYVNQLEKDLNKVISYFKGIEKSIDVLIKKNEAALEMEHWRYEAIGGVGTIISDSIRFMTALVSGISTVIAKGIAQHNKLSVLVEKYREEVNNQQTEFTSFDEDNFWQAIQDKNYLRLKVNMVGAIWDDPTFKRGETDRIIKILEKEVPEIFEKYVELDYEEHPERSAWDKRYFTKLTYYFEENFAKERLEHIKEVGRVVHKDTARKYAKSSLIPHDIKNGRNSYQ